MLPGKPCHRPYRKQRPAAPTTGAVPDAVLYKKMSQFSRDSKKVQAIFDCAVLARSVSPVVSVRRVQK